MSKKETIKTETFTLIQPVSVDGKLLQVGEKVSLQKDAEIFFRKLKRIK